MWWSSRPRRLFRLPPSASERGGQFPLLALGLLLPLLALAGCGWHPLYGSPAYGGAGDELANVHIATIADRTGQNLYNALRDRINPQGVPADPQYDLVIKVQEQQQQMLIQEDQTATRVDLTLFANFALYQRGGDPTHPLMTGQSRAATTYDLLTNQFASVTSEDDARRRGAVSLADDIANQVAAYLAQAPAGQAPAGQTAPGG